MLTMRLEEGEGVTIGDGPDAGAAIKVLSRTGRRVHLSILTNLRITRHVYGLNPPVFAPGLGSARRTDERHAVSCVAG